MIEAIMFFSLGFLGASLIALVLLSAVWHRAVRLTTRRIEGAIPVSMVEIQADKDQLRAEFAMSTRRLENSVEQLKFKTTEQLAEIGRKSESVRILKSEVEEKTARITSLEAHERSIRDKLNSTEEELSSKSRQLHDTEQALAAKENELVLAARAIGNVTSESDSRQVEIIALTTQRDTLKGRIENLEREIAATEQRMAKERDAAQNAADTLRHEQNNVEDLTTRLREMETMFAESKRETESLANTIDSLRNESRRSAELAERREQELAARLSQRENELSAHLAKREGEMLAQLQAREAQLSGELEDSQNKLATAVAELERTRAETRVMHDQVEKASAALHATIDILKSEKAQLEGALSQLREERARLESEVTKLRGEAEKTWAEERVENALLRERINDVAAEVARLVANLEGANSPIERILAADAAQTNGHQNGGSPVAGEARVSLAQRIRNLQSRPR
jgi:chromosome segregation ATPase